MLTDKQCKTIEKCRKLLCNVTPIESDCGALCGGLCCKGDGNTGMILFPGEKTSLKVVDADGYRLAVCDGTCNRTQRPLSCMIFPLFPMINENDEIEIAVDYRGKRICPLVQNCDDVEFNPKFLKRLMKAGQKLRNDKECEAFLKCISEELETIEKISEQK